RDSRGCRRARGGQGLRAAGAALAALRAVLRSLDLRSARRRRGGRRARLGGRATKEKLMLRIYDDVIEGIRRVRPALVRIEKRDPDLARQMKRALSSVALQIAEGSDSRGRNREARYHGSLGSIRESKACLDVAIAAGYIEHVEADTLAIIHRVT